MQKATASSRKYCLFCSGIIGNVETNYIIFVTNSVGKASVIIVNLQSITLHSKRYYISMTMTKARKTIMTMETTLNLVLHIHQVL